MRELLQNMIEAEMLEESHTSGAAALWRSCKLSQLDFSLLGESFFDLIDCDASLTYVLPTLRPYRVSSPG